MYVQKLMHAIPPSQATNAGTTHPVRQLTELPPVEAPTIFPAPSAEFLVILMIGVDALVLVAALFFATTSDRHIDLNTIAAQIFLGQYSKYILIGSLLYLVTFGYMGGYNRQFFFSSTRTMQVVIRTTCTWLIVFLALILAVKLQPPISRYFYIWSFLNAGVFLSAWRLAFCHFLHESHWNVAFRKKALVVGWSKESDDLFNKILRDPGHAYDVIGCVPSAQGKFWVRPPSQVNVLGDYNSLPELIRQHQPDIAIMADLDPVMGEIIALANLCVRENVQFKVIPSYFQTLSSGLHLEHVSGVPVLGVSKLPLDHTFNRILKRAFDVVGSIVGLIASAPMIAFFGYLIRKESPGPIFYTQPRSGLGGKDFKIYKLRSMKLDADADGLVRTVKGDPRCLKVGAFMRKYNIDDGAAVLERALRRDEPGRAAAGTEARMWPR